MCVEIAVHSVLEGLNSSESREIGSLPYFEVGAMIHGVDRQELSKPVARNERVGADIGMFA